MVGAMNRLTCLRALNPIGSQEPTSPGRREISGLVILLMSTCGAALFHWVVILVPVAAALIQWYRRGSKRRERIKSFSNDLPALLVALASIIRAGGDAITALLECRDLFEEGGEMCSQLERFRDQVKAGKTESEALRNFAKDIPLHEVQLLRRALLLARSEGSSLGPALVRLARVTRQRQSFERKVRSALAMQRLSSIGLVACAAGILLFQYSTNPGSVERALANPGGLLCMTAGCVLMIVGTAWMIFLSSRRIGGSKC
jgi:tight adherence protein B